MIPLTDKDEYKFAVILLRLRRATMELIVRHNCEPPPSFTRVVFQLTELHREQPDTVVLDTELALDLGASIAYHRFNGDIIALYGDRRNSSAPARIVVIDLDWQVTGEWHYKNHEAAWRGLHSWMLDQEDAPTGWLRGSTGIAKSSFLRGFTNDVKDPAT